MLGVAVVGRGELFTALDLVLELIVGETGGVALELLGAADLRSFTGSLLLRDMRALEDGSHEGVELRHRQHPHQRRKRASWY